MKVKPIKFDGCYVVTPLIAKDDRGGFVKIYSKTKFEKIGLPTEWCEEYYSISTKDVIRGMHFQTPPHDHEKLVYCINGKALDVVVDLRKKSPTYGDYFSIELTSDGGEGMYIPKGFAHGFLALTHNVIMAYKVTTEYSPLNDSGIKWDSFGFDWGVRDPIISNRDKHHSNLNSFTSPF